MGQEVVLVIAAQIKKIYNQVSPSWLLEMPHSKFESLLFVQLLALHVFWLLQCPMSFCSFSLKIVVSLSLKGWNN